ncbi:MAG: hypothetical protein Q4E71_01155, partial [Prevotella sp.]|nr:hypothetical protein [Prevotella sp.]
EKLVFSVSKRKSQIDENLCSGKAGRALRLPRSRFVVRKMSRKVPGHASKGPENELKRKIWQT